MYCTTENKEKNDGTSTVNVSNLVKKPGTQPKFTAEEIKGDNFAKKVEILHRCALFFRDIHYARGSFL
jgi:hypothetical protein